MNKEPSEEPETNNKLSEGSELNGNPSEEPKMNKELPKET